MNSEPTMKELLDRIPQIGEVAWIGLRPSRNTPMEVVTSSEALVGSGLVGDRFTGKATGIRQVTLIQEEHLMVIEKIISKKVEPVILRRNIMVKGINLLSLHNRSFRIGDVTLKGTGYCHPCSKMEEALGEGGYNAMRGHGGITASIESAGKIMIGDPVSLII